MKTKILKITGITLLTIIAIIWAAPYLLKGKITGLIKSAASKDLKADINFSGVDISWFHHFPNLTIGINDLAVTCVGEFQGDSLISAKRLDILCSVRSFLSGDSIKIYSITAIEPRVHARTHKDGHSNWNIVKSAGTSNSYNDSSARSFELDLQKYAIHQGYIDYVDERKDFHIEVFNLEHDGRGDFNSDQFTLKTKSTADVVNFNLKSIIPFQVTAKTSIDLTLHVDNSTHTYSFNTDQVLLNELKMHSEGFFQWINDSSYNMSVKFKAPSTKFKNLLSLFSIHLSKRFCKYRSKWSG